MDSPSTLDTTLAWPVPSWVAAQPHLPTPLRMVGLAREESRPPLAPRHWGRALLHLPPHGKAPSSERAPAGAGSPLLACVFLTVPRPSLLSRFSQGRILPVFAGASVSGSRAVGRPAARSLGHTLSWRGAWHGAHSGGCTRDVCTQLTRYKRRSYDVF